MKPPSQERMQEALRKAIVHIERQRFAGKHAADRDDAVQWLTEYADVVARIRDMPGWTTG